MGRVVMTGARNVQQELLQDHARDGPIILHARPLNGRGDRHAESPKTEKASTPILSAFAIVTGG